MKGTRLYSILFNKCPRCHEGNFFITNNPYNLPQFDKQHKECSVCHEDFDREVGFYYGAMYVSYGLNVAMGVGLFLLLCVILDFSVITFLVSYVIAVVLLLPVLYRKSRIIWINLFVGYRGKEQVARVDKKV